MKTIALFMMLAPVFALAQQPKPKPKPPTQKDRVRSEVLLKTKSSLALPKYFKLEKLDVILIEKAHTQTEDEHGEPCLPWENPKFLRLTEPRLTVPELTTFKLYSVDSVIKDTKEDNTYIIYFTNPEDYNPDVDFVYYNMQSTDLDFFTDKSKVKKRVPAIYATNIYYWAMSKGGDIRLYNDKGTASVDDKGLIVYEVDEE